MTLKNITNYCFLTEGISNYGGAQLLVLRRALYLKKLGHSVKIIVIRHRGEFFLDEKFKDVPVLFLPDLEYPFSIISKNKKIELSKTIELFLKDISNCVIETHSLQTAVWGEYFSSLINAKHIVYLLNEAKVSRYKYFPGSDFFNFKYLRGELFGTSDQSYNIIFETNAIVDDENNFINVSFDPKEFSEFSEPSLLHFEFLDGITVSTLGRLEKGYIEPMIDAVVKFAIQNPKQNINLLIAGGSFKKSVEANLKEKFLKQDNKLINLRIIFTGYIINLGRDFFKKTDIFIGMGTASINAISEGCATLNIDPRSNKTSGIFGVDTINFAYPGVGGLFSIEEKLKSLLSDKNELIQAKQKGKELFEAQFTNHSAFLKFEKIIERSNDEKIYYKYKYNFSSKLLDYILFNARRLYTKIK